MFLAPTMTVEFPLTMKSSSTVSVVPPPSVSVASLSSVDEARLLAQEGYRERIAVALHRGIRTYSESVAGTATSTEAR